MSIRTISCCEPIRGFLNIFSRMTDFTLYPLLSFPVTVISWQQSTDQQNRASHHDCLYFCLHRPPYQQPSTDLSSSQAVSKTNTAQLDSSQHIDSTASLLQSDISTVPYQSPHTILREMPELFEISIDIWLILTASTLHAATILLIAVLFGTTLGFLLRQYRRGVIPLKIT